MWVWRRSCFRAGSIWLTGGVIGASFLLTACSSSPPEIGPQASLTPPKPAVAKDTPVAGWLATQQPAAAPAGAPTKTKPAAAPSTEKKVALKPPASQPPLFGADNPKRSTLGGLTREPAQSASAWCEYLRRDAAATATILRSPTVAGEINDVGDKAIAIDLDVMDLAKARLIERAAIARCKRFQANVTLKEQAIAQPHRLTRAGFRAKADLIDSRRGLLRSYKKQTTKALEEGNMTVAHASGLTVAIARIIADGARARSQADRRSAARYDVRHDIGLAQADLVAATRELDRIKRHIRTTDALSLKVIGGWRGKESGGTNSLDRDETDTGGTDYYGKLKMSVRLGALNPARRWHELAASEAQLQALREEGGPVWVLQMVSDAHRKALQGLYAAQTQLQQNAFELRRAIQRFSIGDRRQFLAALLKAKIELIQTDAQIAALAASIAEIRSSRLAPR